MRIGDITNTLMMMANYQNQYAKRYASDQEQITTGKKPTDPSTIGRIARTQAQINQMNVEQNNLEDSLAQNQSMTNTLTAESSSANTLVSLSEQYNQSGADQTSIESQAGAALNAMASTMASASYNGANPFSDASSPKFTIQTNATDSTKYDITLNDGTTLSSQSVSDILSSDAVKTNLLDPISSAQSDLVTSSTLLKTEQDLNTNQQLVLNKELSNLQDADVTKVTADAAIQQSMVGLTQNLMNAYTATMKQQVGSLFDALA